MGCHIHLLAEKETPEGWVIVADPYSPDDNYWTDSWQHYPSFALLAGVKNTYGVEPLMSPRGLPSGISETVALEFDIWKDSHHNAGWVTVSELYATDWTRVVLDSRGSLVPLLVFANSLYVVFSKLLLLQIEEQVRLIFWFDN